MNAAQSFAIWWINTSPSIPTLLRGAWNLLYNVGITICSFVDNIANDIQNWVDDIINPIQNFVETIWNKAVSAWDYADNIYNSVIPNVESDLENWAEGIFQKIGQGVGDVWSLVEGDVEGLINDSITNVENWATNVVNATATDLQNWTNDAIDAAITGLGDIESIAKTAFNDLWTPIYTDVIQPLEGAYGDVRGAVDSVVSGLDDVWHWINGAATDVVNAVEKAWDWIVFLGDHTISDLKATFAAVPESVSWSDAEQWIAQDAEGLGNMIDSVITSVFGG